MIKPDKTIFGKLGQSISIFFRNFGTFFIVSIIFGIISIFINILFSVFSDKGVVGMIAYFLSEVLQYIFNLLLILATSKVVIDIINGNKVSAIESIKEIFANIGKYIKIIFTFLIRAYKWVIVLGLLTIGLGGYLMATIPANGGTPNASLGTVFFVVIISFIISLIYATLIYFAWSYIVFDKNIYDGEKLEKVSMKIGWSRRGRTLGNFIVIGLLIYIILGIIVGVLYSIFPNSKYNVLTFEDILTMSTLGTVIVTIVGYVIGQIVFIYTGLLYKQYDEEENKNTSTDVKEL